MNELLLPRWKPLGSAGRLLKEAAWSAASQFALHGLCGWRLDEQCILLERRQLHLPTLPRALDGLRIAHLSDLHCCPLMREKHLMTFVETVNQLQPDLVVLTGDFISSNTRFYVRQVARVVGRLEAKLATLAVLGNHDYGLYHPTQPIIRGLAESLTDQMQAQGVQVLVNRSHTLRRHGAELRIAGAGERWSDDYRPAATLPNGGDRPGIATIALTHNPDSAADLIARGADYVLAGHTHGRGTPPTKLHRALFPVKYPHLVAGHYDLPGGGVYINRGIGPSRRDTENTRPEITCLTLRSGRPTPATTWRTSRFHCLGEAHLQPGACCPLPNTN
jgi:hypothetical protein